MLLSIFLFFLIAVTLVSSSPSNLHLNSESTTNGEVNSWNELLNSPSLFKEPENLIFDKSYKDAAIIQQLQDLLSNDQFLWELHQTHKKVYAESTINKTVPGSDRVNMFKQQILKIANHNLEANAGRHKWWMGVNQFTDMDPSELSEYRESNKPRLQSNNKTYEATPGAAAPKSYFCTDMGLVTPVKNQGKCGTSSIFAAKAAHESAHLKMHPNTEILSFSVQQVIDCADVTGFCCQAGCSDFSLNDTIREMHDNLFGYNWFDYLYSNPPAKGTCRKEGLTPKGQIERDHPVFTQITEEKLKQLLVEFGVVIVSIHASDSMRQNYAKGVYPGAECGPTPANHYVALAGYGTENGQDYWLIKNSWGQYWGSQGFLKLARNGSNVCQILNEVTVIKSR